MRMIIDTLLCLIVGSVIFFGSLYLANTLSFMTLNVIIAIGYALGVAFIVWLLTYKGPCI